MLRTTRISPSPALALLVFAGLVHALPLSAQEAEPERWQATAELSYTDQSGNRDLRLLTGGFDISHLQKDRFRLDASLQTRYGESEGKTVARRHYGSLAFDLDPENRWSPFLFADAERDRFKRLAARVSGGAGAKYTLYRNRPAKSEASVSLALLASREEFFAPPSGVNPPSRTTARWSLRARGKRQLREGFDVHHTTFVQPVYDHLADYLLRSETGAKLLLDERLAFAVEYQVDRNARPPAGVRPNDTIFKTGLIINF